MTASKGMQPASQRTLWRLTWRWLPRRAAAQDDALMQACARLFSEHYGKWGTLGPNPGQPIQMAAPRVRALLADDAAWLAAAFHDGELIGYCVATRVAVGGLGRVDWVTQLVVHPSFRQARVES